MARVLYFDCFSGISGDMALGAMLDAGLPLEELKGALVSLSLSGLDGSAAPFLRAGLSATKFTLHEHGGAQHDHGHHTHRHLSAISGLIDKSALSTTGRDRAKAMFQ